MERPTIDLSDVVTRRGSLKKVETTVYTRSDGTRYSKNNIDGTCTEIEPLPKKSAKGPHKVQINEVPTSPVVNRPKNVPKLKINCSEESFVVDTDEWKEHEALSRTQRLQSTNNNTLRVITWNVWFDSYFAAER